MQEDLELEFLEKSDLESIFERVNNYLDYIFEADEGKRLTPTEIPTVWAVYILCYFNSQIENGGFRQFLWNSNARFNDDVLKALKSVESNDYLDIFRDILVRFNSDPEESQQFLSHDFSDELSKNIREDLRKITWAFMKKIYAGKVTPLITKLEEYIRKNYEVLAKELALIKNTYC